MKTYSTGEVAKLCDVNLRTVIRWIDRGALKGYKLPGRGNNRVTEKDFLAFLHENGMPIPSSLLPRNNRILIVDDEEPVAKALQRVLRSAGYDTVLALDSFHAGARLLQDKPVLVTLDLNMPSLDGFGVIEFIRNNPEISHIRILVISALAESELNKALEMGADAVLPKPFENEQLISLVEQLTERETVRG